MASRYGRDPLAALSVYHNYLSENLNICSWNNVVRAKYCINNQKIAIIRCFNNRKSIGP